DVAGNDCAGAQIAVRAKKGVRGLSARADPLAGPGAAPAISLSRVATIRLEKPSGPDGRQGEWPDALIPARDAIFGEARNALPVDVAPDWTQSIFVEICAPGGAAAGRYAGEVRLSWTHQGAAGGAAIPISVRVRGFDLPA